MLRHLLTIVLLGILLIDAQAQALTPPAGTFRTTEITPENTGRSMKKRRFMALLF